ncbi:MAG: mechanosensitive ion channel domain-containing protein [Microcoleaceae cyanobacterium]
MFKDRIGTLMIVSVVCTTIAWGVPSKAQELPIEETSTEAVTTPSNSTTSALALTTADPEIPEDELKLLVKPLTLPQLETEAAAWQVLLQQKVQKISDAEIAVKRENRIIKKQEEAAQALEEASQALEAAQESQSTAAAGSPEYEEATRQLEEAQENLEIAQEAVEEAQEIKAELKQDEVLQSAIEEAKETGEIEQAKEILELARLERERVDYWSYDYEDMTQQMDRLEVAIETFEETQEIKANTPPNTWEYEQATQQFEAARNDLKQAVEALEWVDPNSTDSTEQSSQNLNQTADLIANTEINRNIETKVASSIEGTNTLENIEQKQDQLENAAEQLEEKAEANSELKNQLVSNVTELEAERTAIIDRFEVVLDELQRKGGEINSYQDYIKAVSTLELDLEDTEGLGVRLMGWVTSEEGGIRWATKLAIFTTIVIISVIISYILSLIISKSLSKFGNTSELFREFVVVLVRRGGVIIGCLVGLTALEVSLGPILALVGGASFILAFALQSNLANLASGLMLMVYKPFDTGDEVMVGDIWGYVDSITLASTKIKGFKNEMISIPNDTVWSSTIKNLTADETRNGKITIRISFKQNISEVEQILVEIGTSHPLVLKASTSVWEYAEYYVSIKFAFITKTSDFWTVRGDLHRTIQQRFHQEGIEIALPTQDLRVHSDASLKDVLPLPTVKHGSF